MLYSVVPKVLLTSRVSGQNVFTCLQFTYKLEVWQVRSL